MVQERRWNGGMSGKVDDALRAHGTLAAARAMEHQQVPIRVAMRVLANPAQRRTPCVR